MNFTWCVYSPWWYHLLGFVKTKLRLWMTIFKRVCRKTLFIEIWDGRFNYIKCYSIYFQIFGDFLECYRLYATISYSQWLNLLGSDCPDDKPRVFPRHIKDYVLKIVNAMAIKAIWIKSYCIQIFIRICENEALH